MEFADDAKQEIEKNLKEIMRNTNVDVKGKEEIEKELRSTYYEAAETAARARGATTVTTADVKTAKEDMGSPSETAECLTKSYAGTLRRAGFWPRLAAFIIDNVIMVAAAMILMVPMFAVLMAIDAPTTAATPLAGSPLWVQVLAFGLMFATMISVIIVAFGYYIVLEGHFGYTVGKYLLGLRVLKTDGTKAGYKEALLRNLSKYINNLILIDTLIMLIFFNKEKQRGFDKIANTMVVHVRG